MKLYARFIAATGEILSFEAGLLLGDPAAGISAVPINVEVNHPIAHYRLNTAGDGIELRPQAEIDIIEARRAEIEGRPAAALGKIKIQLAALLAETDPQTMARAAALDLAGAKNEIGKIEVLLKHLIFMLRPGLKETVGA